MSRFVDIEIRGGLGDMILQLHETTAWEELCALGPDDRARVTLLCHNPFADELLKWHPHRDRIEVVKPRHFFYEHDDAGARRFAGIHENPAPRRPERERKPLVFFPSSEDLDTLDVHIPRVPFLVVAPTASGLEIENRDISDAILSDICITTLRRSIPVVLLGRTYQGPHAPKRVPSRPIHRDIVDMTDKLSVPGTLEVLRRARAGLFAHSALLQYAWLNRIPNFVLYPPKYKRHDFDNPSPFGKGKDFPETTRMLFSEFKPRHLDEFLAKHFKRGESAVTNQIDPQYNVFHSWYVDGGPGSGPGSTPEYTVAWRHFLEGFIRGSGARSVLDFGCGDWQFSRMINWGDVTYHGVDIVPSLIDRLSREHGRPGVRFSVVDPKDPVLPVVDLLITKDVLQHLPNVEVSRLLAKFSCARTWILVNDRPPDFVEVNQDSPIGGYREIDFTKPPFSLKGKEIFQFGPPWRKVAFLVQR